MRAIACRKSDYMLEHPRMSEYFARSENLGPMRTISREDYVLQRASDGSSPWCPRVPQGAYRGNQGGTCPRDENVPRVPPYSLALCSA